MNFKFDEFLKISSLITASSLTVLKFKYSKQTNNFHFVTKHVTKNYNIKLVTNQSSKNPISIYYDN